MIGRTLSSLIVFQLFTECLLIVGVVSLLFPEQFVTKMSGLSNNLEFAVNGLKDLPMAVKLTLIAVILGILFYVLHQSFSMFGLITDKYLAKFKNDNPLKDGVVR